MSSKLYTFHIRFHVTQKIMGVFFHYFQWACALIVAMYFIRDTAQYVWWF